MPIPPLGVRALSGGALCLLVYGLARSPLLVQQGAVVAVLFFALFEWLRACFPQTGKRHPILYGIGLFACLGSGAFAFGLLERSPKVLLFLLVTVAIGDSCALIGGKIFRGRALAPKISPNKTRSGLWCGLIGPMAASFWTVPMIFGFCNTPKTLGLAGFLALCGHLGDLAESWAKRHFGIKDTGALIPGHGGILDRLDSQLGALTGFFLLTYWKPSILLYFS